MDIVLESGLNNVRCVPTGLYFSVWVSIIVRHGKIICPKNCDGR